MDFGPFQNLHIPSLSAIVGVSLLIAAVDSIRRRRSRLRPVLVEPTKSHGPKTIVPQAVTAMAPKTAPPLVSPPTRIIVPTLPFGALLPLPQPNPRLLGKAEPLKAYGFVLK
jgi:hypothetical protein